MNISSVVLHVNPESTDLVIARIQEDNVCEYHLHNDSGKIVVTIEGKDVEEELEKFQYLKSLPNVLSASMAFSYSEDELDEVRKNLEKVDQLPDWLNDEKAKLKDIKYGGDLKGRF